MNIDTERMVSVGKFQKELTGKLRELTADGKPLFIMRNNALAAVILSPAEYDQLQNAAEIIDHLEAAELIERRTKGHDRAINIPWEKVKAERGL